MYAPRSLQIDDVLMTYVLLRKLISHYFEEKNMKYHQIIDILICFFRVNIGFFDLLVIWYLISCFSSSFLNLFSFFSRWTIPFKYHLVLVLHDTLYKYLPRIITSKFALCDRPRATRRKQHFSETVHSVNGSIVPNYRHYNYRLFSLFCQAPRTWNNIIASRVLDMQDIPPSKSLFKKCVKLIFIDEY